MLLRQKQRAALLLTTKEMRQLLDRQEAGKYRSDIGLGEVEIPCSVPFFKWLYLSCGKPLTALLLETLHTSSW